jgi:YVTN family beta-propeller protein
VANNCGNTVSLADASTKTTTATIPVGATPYGVVVSPDRALACVVDRGSDHVSVIDTSTNSVTAAATVGIGSAPQGVAVDPSGSLVYVTNANGDTLSVFTVAPGAPGRPRW